MVEECRWVDVALWVREGTIAPQTHRLGSWLWLDAGTGERRSSIGYEVGTSVSVAWVRLF